MRTKARALLILLLSFGLALTGLPAQAQMASKDASGDQVTAVGLIVKYAPGVSRIAPDGSPTSENFAGVGLSNPRGLGEGLYALNFEQKLTSAQANRALAQIKRDPRVKSAQLDSGLRVDASAMSSERSKPAVEKLARFATSFSPMAVQRAASAPTNLKVANSVASSSLRKARVRLTWQAPTTLFGARVYGYRIEYRRAGASTWSLAYSSTSSTVTSAYVSTGLVVGAVTSFRVRALTKSSLGRAVGLPSLSKSLTAKIAPLPPTLTSPNVLFQGEYAIWNEQTLNERGGDSVTYTVTAIEPGGDTQTCVTTAVTCRLNALQIDRPYTIQVAAKNSVATAKTEKVSDSLYGTQWHLYSQYSVHADKAWQTTQGSPDVVVAVLDSGITAHPDLDAQVLPGYDFISDAASAHDSDGWDSDPTDMGDWDARNSSSWHGTHVAGIIAASANSIGVRGVAPKVKILPVRVLGVTGGAQSDLIAAIHWASGIPVPGVPDNAHPAKVINLSIGTTSAQGCDSGTQSALRAAWDAGSTPVTAAGNSAFEAVRSYPGNCYPTINVAATGVTGDIAGYSNYGDGVDFSAPGGDSDLSAQTVSGSDGMILSTWNLGTRGPGQADYGLEEGTSMAAPVVSGVVALLYSVRADLTSDDVYKILLSTVQNFKPGSTCANTAQDYGSQTATSHCGAGIVNAGEALTFAKVYVHQG